MTVEEAKRGRPRADIPVNEVARRNRSGETLSGMTDDYNVTVSTLSRHLKEAGYEVRAYGGRPAIELPVEEAARRNQEGETLKEIAEDYGVTSQTLSNRLKEAGYEIVAHYSWIPRKELPVDEMAERYRDGESLRSIAEDYPASHETIRKRLIEMDVSIRGNRGWGHEHGNGD